MIRFTADEDMSLMSLADYDPEKEDRIMCIGNPQNEWFAISCGKGTSGKEKLGESTDFPGTGMKHTAYIQVGSTGRSM